MAPTTDEYVPALQPAQPRLETRLRPDEYVPAAQVVHIEAADIDP